jgi:hypothetical protein
MEKFIRLSKKIMFLCTVFLLYSCNQDELTNVEVQSNSTYSLTGKISTTKFNVFKGPEVTVGYGKARSWISLNSEGFPMEIGIEINQKALLNPERDKKMAAESGSTIFLPLHLKAKQATPFDHIGLNWNPHGHEPDHVFDVPHYDIHFYMISIEEQLAIPNWSAETDALFNNYPAAEFLPADYFTPPGAGTAEGQMGKHWLPVNLPAFLPFTKIMIYGTYNGKVAFVEPMVTEALLLSDENTSESFSQPASFQKKGNYPTMYNIYHDPITGSTHITLSHFVHRN